MTDEQFLSEKTIYAKALSRKIAIGVNPSPWDLRDLWIYSNKKGYPNTHVFRFMIDRENDIYVWSGEIGNPRFIIRGMGKTLQHFKVFGEFEVDPMNPRKLTELRFAGKNVFMMRTDMQSKQLFFKIAKKLRWKRTPGLK